ncbi:MAG: cell division protein FtsA [Bryobacterales bacterium]|nr:hypothetical protein [Bryobacteraceae bacterium]MDW8131173.1 cell division protein FtsA [Bryobacterales bacterium]
MSQEGRNRFGLDVGTSRIVLARRSGEEYQFDSQLNAFVSIPWSKLTCEVLEKERIPHARSDGQILVFGDASERFADLLHTETRRPMLEGALNPEEPEGLSVVRAIVELLTGGLERKGSKLCYSIPAPPVGSPDAFKFHRVALAQMLEELGFEVRSLEEGLAVIFAELADFNYTGIGVSLGAGLTNVCLAYLSVPVVSFSLPKAGDHVDAGAAAAAGEVATRVRVLKEQYFSLNGLSSDRLPGKLRQALRVFYDDLIRGVIEAMQEAFEQQRALPRLNRPLPLVLAGGTALVPGFRDRFEHALRQTDFPLRVSEIRLAADPLHAPAKGALVAALADM